MTVDEWLERAGLSDAAPETKAKYVAAVDKSVAILAEQIEADILAANAPARGELKHAAK